jgi:hypothetical protein
MNASFSPLPSLNDALNLPAWPVTRLARSAPPRIPLNGGGQGARPSRPAGYARRYADGWPLMSVR